jgi:uncharacterized membrane protein YhaH (DUF805 family)
MDVGKLFFSTHGRIGRQEFWLAWLALFAIVTMTGWIPLFGVVIWAVSVYCTICIYAKRLHDMGRTGWLQVIPIIAKVVVGVIGFYFVIGLILGAIGFRADALGESVAAVGFITGLATLITAALLAFLVEIAFLIWIGISPRDPYENLYGPAPDTSFEDYRSAMPVV